MLSLNCSLYYKNILSYQYFMKVSLFYILINSWHYQNLKTLMGVKWHLTAFLICISRIFNEAMHLFLFFFIIEFSSSVNSVHTLYIFFWLVSTYFSWCMCIVVFLIVSHLILCHLDASQKFSPSLWLMFSLCFIVPFAVCAFILQCSSNDIPQTWLKTTSLLQSGGRKSKMAFTELISTFFL